MRTKKDSLIVGFTEAENSRSNILLFSKKLDFLKRLSLITKKFEHNIEIVND